MPPEKRSKRTWDPNAFGAFTSYPQRIYSKIKIPTVCNGIISTRVFQRLNNSKQLGAICEIFKRAIHTRYEHSLGFVFLIKNITVINIRVAELARRVMKRLRKLSEDVTETDMLCVIIAALCCNLGHGPFSHSFVPFIYQIKNGLRVSFHIYS